MRLMRLLALLTLLISQPVLAGKIALTFDDAPTPGSEVMTGQERTERLLRELRQANVDEALFFVTTRHIDADSEPRLRAYTKAGHWLGNHSHAHVSANETPPHEFLLDAYKAHLSLKQFDNLLPLYRFPYLHHGQSREVRQTLRDGLGELGYSIGYVTVDNFDWYLDSLYRNAVKANKKVDLDKLRDLYIDTIWSAVLFYDDIAKKSLGRSPRHVLLLHENDIAATFIGDLVRHIEAQGWEIISPREAYLDPLHEAGQDLEFTKQGRIAALAHQKGIPVEQLRHETENTDHLDRLFEQHGVIGQ